MTQPTPSRFIEVFSSLFKGEQEIKKDTVFRNLEEWSSLQALIVIAAIDEHFGVTISEQEFRNAKSVNDLYEITRSRSIHA